MQTFIRRFLKDEAGITAVEVAMIVSMVAIGIMVSAQSFVKD